MVIARYQQILEQRKISCSCELKYFIECTLVLIQVDSVEQFNDMQTDDVIITTTNICAKSIIKNHTIYQIPQAIIYQ